MYYEVNLPEIPEKIWSNFTLNILSSKLNWFEIYNEINLPEIYYEVNLPQRYEINLHEIYYEINLPEMYY